MVFGLFLYFRNRKFLILNMNRNIKLKGEKNEKRKNKKLPTLDRDTQKDFADFALPEKYARKKSDKQLTDTAHWLVEQRTRLTELLIYLADFNIRLTCSLKELTSVTCLNGC